MDPSMELWIRNFRERITADEEALKNQEVLHLISPGLITQKRELIEREREWVSALEKSLL